MPNMTVADLQPRQFVVELDAPPITEVESATGWAMSYHTARRPQELFYEIQGLGESEREALDKLPQGVIRMFAKEADDPEVMDYLREALRTENPYGTIVLSLTEAIHDDYIHGGGSLSLNDFGGLKRYVKKAKKAVKSVAKKAVELPKKAIELHKKVAKKIQKVGKKTWKKYGNVIIGIAGAVLAIPTGGASLAAAAALSSANTMYQAKRNADAAKKMAKKEAAELAAEAAKQEAEVRKQVDDFFAQNKEWFYQNGMTDADWAGLTLDQKISFINAAVTGQFQPVGSTMPPQATNTVPPTFAPAPPPPPAAAPPPPPPSTPSYGTPSYGTPSYAPPSYPSGGEPSYAPPPSDPGAPPPPAAAQQVYDVVIEGQKRGSFGTLDEASAFIMDNTTPGDRFEVFLNGQSTGLNIRTGQGAVEVPPEAAAKMRSLSREEAGAVVAGAEREQATVPAKSGGFPWLLLLAGGAAIAVASQS